MEIYLDSQTTQQIRLSIDDAVEEHDTESLREDLYGVFSSEDIEEIERRVDVTDFHEFITEILDEWDEQGFDELMELLEVELASIDIGLKYETTAADEDGDDDDVDGDMSNSF